MKPTVQDWQFGLGKKGGEIEPMDMDTKAKRYISDKFKNVSAISFTTFGDELVINFSGFDHHDDLKEFADFVFAKIKMRYSHLTDPPTIH